MSLFKTETLKPIILETDYNNLASADVTRILYRKPGGTEGFWQANVSGKNLIYQPVAGDLDTVGQWTFQAYIEIGGQEGHGSLVTYQVQKPISP